MKDKIKTTLLNLVNRKDEIRNEILEYEEEALLEKLYISFNRILSRKEMLEQ